MATDRVYGNFQWAGVKVTTAAKSQVNSEGTDAYAVLVVPASGSGPVSPTNPSYVTSGDPTSTTAVIANGASLSASAQVHGKLVGIITPAAWTAAAITFQGSQDGTNFYDIYDAAVERTIASGAVPTGSAVELSLNLADWLCVNYVKVRSGTSASPVNQGAARTVTLVMAG